MLKPHLLWWSWCWCRVGCCARRCPRPPSSPRPPHPRPRGRRRGACRAAGTRRPRCPSPRCRDRGLVNTSWCHPRHFLLHSSEWFLWHSSDFYCMHLSGYQALRLIVLVFEWLFWSPSDYYWNYKSGGVSPVPSLSRLSSISLRTCRSSSAMSSLARLSSSRRRSSSDSRAMLPGPPPPRCRFSALSGPGPCSPGSSGGSGMLGRLSGGRGCSGPPPVLWLYIWEENICVNLRKYFVLSLTLSRASRVISKADSGSWGPVGRPGGERDPEMYNLRNTL